MFFTSKIYISLHPRPLRTGTARQPLISPPKKTPRFPTRGTTGLMGAAIFRSFLKSKPLKKGCCRICSALKRSCFTTFEGFEALKAVGMMSCGWWGWWGCFGDVVSRDYLVPKGKRTISPEQTPAVMSSLLEHHKSFGLPQGFNIQKPEKSIHHQEFQVPYKAILEVGFPWHKPYIQLFFGEYLHFRYPKCLVNPFFSMVGYQLDDEPTNSLCGKLPLGSRTFQNDDIWPLTQENPPWKFPTLQKKKKRKIVQNFMKFILTKSVN